MNTHKKIYKAILDTLDTRPTSRGELIDQATSRLGRSGKGAELMLGERSRLRGEVGAVVSEMEDNGLLILCDGTYILASEKPVALRAESCEEEVVTLIREGARTKQEIREALIKRFGTDKTLSTRDDSILFSLLGQVLKRLIGFGVLELYEGMYRIAPEKLARLDDISDILSLKTEFFTRLHSKGGEFFEHFILTLLTKHLSKNGKTVTEAYVTGGADDRGIDGVIKTTDSLGFREVLMIQAKNRLEPVNETSVRGFFGAVCAMQGSRGIFATTSDFHPIAREFLDSIDNCVGVSADDIFKMACECLYGVKRRDGKYFIDTKII